MEQMGYLKKMAIGIGLAFLTTSTVRYWTQKPAPPVVYVQPVPVPVVKESDASRPLPVTPVVEASLEDRLRDDVQDALQVYRAR